jgi:hypothetical protein
MESRMEEFMSKKQYSRSCLILTPGPCRADRSTSAQEHFGITKHCAEVGSGAHLKCDSVYKSNGIMQVCTGYHADIYGVSCVNMGG